MNFSEKSEIERNQSISLFAKFVNILFQNYFFNNFQKSRFLSIQNGRILNFYDKEN